MLGALSTYLPAPGGPLPDPTVTVTSLTERTVGMGNLRGSDPRGAFQDADTKGIRLDAVARFALWASGPAQADNAITLLASKLAGAGTTLWTQGFLKLTMEAAPPPEIVSSINAWRKHADYRVLYEYAYSDTGGAESLIARIPIAVDSVFNETTTVTDDMVRWDDLAAPALIVRGPMTVGALSFLLFVAGASPAKQVTLTRTFDGASGPPANHATLADFLTAVAGPAPAERHAQVVFDPFSNFVAAANADGASLLMGDWNNDNIPDKYDPLRTPLGAGVTLAQPEDRFEVAYQVPAFERVAVMYLRATRG